MAVSNHSTCIVSYLNISAPTYTLYVHKHNPTTFYDSLPSCLVRHRNFNDFAADINTSVVPQWLFVTPNMVNDGRDTTIDFTGRMVIRPQQPHLRPGAVPESARGTVDSTYDTHHSSLSTVEANWGLGLLCCGDMNKYALGSPWLTSHPAGRSRTSTSSSPTRRATRTSTSPSPTIPLTSITGTILGPLNVQYYVLGTAPNTSAIDAGGGPVFVMSGLDTSFTAAAREGMVGTTALGALLAGRSSGSRGGLSATRKRYWFAS
ncbi:hypothetical protein EDB83DRAFT_2520217 [Lactarius deliciosus]|nr:hypothetical protein EDB83DRAFT_2520217 [Lactarius deliciosus]